MQWLCYVLVSSLELNCFLPFTDAKEKSRTEKKILPDLQGEQYMGPPADLSHTVYESDSHESLTCESLKSSVSLNFISVITIL